MIALPTDAKTRKEIPIGTGFIDYFPLAIAAVAELSRIGNEQHNPGKPLRWDRSKSGDESDALMRHFIERGTIDTDGVRHSAKVAWRAMALLEKELEAYNARESAWIEWHGGQCPVDVDQIVDIVPRDGFVETYRAGGFIWSHEQNGTDIVKYRLSK